MKMLSAYNAYCICLNELQNTSTIDILFVAALRPSYQFFSHVGTGFPKLNQY